MKLLAIATILSAMTVSVSAMDISTGPIPLKTESKVEFLKALDITAPFIPMAHKPQEVKAPAESNVEAAKDFTLECDGLGATITSVGPDIDSLEYRIVPYYYYFKNQTCFGENAPTVLSGSLTGAGKISFEGLTLFSDYVLEVRSYDKQKEAVDTKTARIKYTGGSELSYYCTATVSNRDTGIPSSSTQCNVYTIGESDERLFIERPFYSNEYMIVNFLPNGFVSFEPLETGYSYYSDNGYEPIMIRSTAEYYMAFTGNGLESVPERFFGVHKNGVIIFGEDAVAAVGPSIPDGHLMSFAEITIKLPWGKDDRFELAKDGNSQFKINFVGEDVEKIVYAAVTQPEWSENTGSIVDAFHNNDFKDMAVGEIAPTDKYIDLLTLDLVPGKEYVLVAASYIDNQPMVFHSYQFTGPLKMHYYASAQYNDFLLDLFGVPSEDCPVDVYEDNEKSGLLYIEDPYYMYQYYFEYTLGNYIILDISDPEKVSMPLSNTGLIHNGTPIQILDYDYGCYDEETGNVTFPPQSLIVVLGDQGYYGNREDHVLLCLPPKSKIETIDAANAAQPVEYFDILGRKVKEPVRNGVYIRRQGNSTAKILR